MYNECKEYAMSIANELSAYYSGEKLTEDNEQASLYDYVAENALDVEYTLDSSKRLIGVCIYVTLGGPTCWIDTRRNTVTCHWGSDSAEVYIDNDLSDELTECYNDGTFSE